ncbi:hypothetical protein QE152_g4158 [Popillia japonica]|uniref:Uncharacterized protein n=1 Tax=Popillia japonica TaxID=7064 RepID=A0AAW1MZV6_POPJA
MPTTPRRQFVHLFVLVNLVLINGVLSFGPGFSFQIYEDWRGNCRVKNTVLSSSSLNRLHFTVYEKGLVFPHDPTYELRSESTTKDEALRSPRPS